MGVSRIGSLIRRFALVFVDIMTSLILVPVLDGQRAS